MYAFPSCDVRPCKILRVDALRENGVVRLNVFQSLLILRPIGPDNVKIAQIGTDFLEPVDYDRGADPICVAKITNYELKSNEHLVIHFVAYEGGTGYITVQRGLLPPVSIKIEVADTIPQDMAADATASVPDLFGAFMTNHYPRSGSES